MSDLAEFPKSYIKWEQLWRQRILRAITDLDDFAEQLSKEDIFNHSKFKKVRPRFGTQSDWAAAVGVSQATIGNYERNTTYPNKSIRAAILDAVTEFRALEASKLAAPAHRTSEIDVVAAREALDSSILNAALTDFEFDSSGQRIISVPFNDNILEHIEQIQAERIHLLASLAWQAETLANSMAAGANTNVSRIAETLSDYHVQCVADNPNARLIYRSGNNINRSSANDEIAWGIKEFDKVALEGFIDDHNELMRLFYREALVKLQEVDAVQISEGVDLPRATDFHDIAMIIQGARDEEGEALFDETISVLIKDIAREIEETEENETLAIDPERKRILRRRRTEAVKNGSILIGRFLIFASFAVAFDPIVSIGVAGSIASIVGLVEQKSPGTVRSHYERLRAALPFLPKFPVKGS